MIGKRQPWISPSELAEVLKNKIRNPAIITIAYSVNGGFTPIKYRHLGDEVAYRFSPLRFKKRYARLFKAARHFGLFTSSGRKEDYQKAAALNPAYRSFDNTYGPLYLASRRFSKAESEFRKIIRVDPENPFPRVGLGCIALERGDYHRAKRFFSYAARKKSLPQAVCGLAQAEFRLSYHKKAKRLFLRYLKSERLQPQSYYFLGRIYEKEKDFKKAIVYYKSAVGLGLNHIGLLKRIIHIARSTKTADDNLINYSVKRYKELKKSFYGEKDILRKDKRNLNHMKRIEDRIRAFDDFIAPYMRCRQ
jgi:tetratricopeptide (TPR) repeat protein